MADELKKYVVSIAGHRVGGTLFKDLLHCFHSSEFVGGRLPMEKLAVCLVDVD